MTGVERIQAVFARSHAEHRAAFMPYHAMGYPDRPRRWRFSRCWEKLAPISLRIGIPHSDPLADGPTIQTATYEALMRGTTVVDCLAMVRELRTAGMTQPFCAMTYYNPLFAYGVQRFVDDAVAAGIDGLIVPDLPPEEAEDLEAACRAAGLATIYLLAPASTPERIQFVAAHCTGFIYLVSVTGITGSTPSCPLTWLNLFTGAPPHAAAAGGRVWHCHRRTGVCRCPDRRRCDRRVGAGQGGCQRGGAGPGCRVGR
jgi:tryptophan synthase alpha chain